MTKTRAETTVVYDWFHKWSLWDITTSNHYNTEMLDRSYIHINDISKYFFCFLLA